MGTVGPHLGLPKTQPVRKAALHGPQRNGDQPQHPVSEEEEEEEDEDSSTGVVWTPCREFQKIN